MVEGGPYAGADLRLVWTLRLVRLPRYVTITRGVVQVASHSDCNNEAFVFLCYMNTKESELMLPWWSLSTPGVCTRTSL